MKPEPEIIDYYRSTPSCFHTIERLNEEFDEIQSKHQELLNKTQTPVVVLSREEFKKRNCIMKINTVNRIREYVIINYSRMQINGMASLPPNMKFRSIIYDLLDSMFHTEPYTYQCKIKEYSQTITHNVYIFLESIINSYSNYRYNVYQLSDMIIDIVQRMTNELVEDIIRYQCSECKKICGILFKDKCNECQQKIKYD